MLSQMVIPLGLFLDIVGVVLVWKFAIPERDRIGGDYLLLEAITEDSKNKIRLYDRIAFLGILLIIVGFVLQLVGNWL